MSNISIFKKISLYYEYKKILKKLEKQLSREFNIRIDRVARFYTVLNVPEDIFEEPYNIRKSDIDTIGQNFIKDYSKKISNFLDSNGLSELYDFYDIEKVDKYSYLLVFGFKFFNTQKFFRNIYLFWLPSIVLIGLLTILYFSLI